MKRKTHFLLLAVTGILLCMSCQDKIEETYTVLEPEYMAYSDLRNAFRVKSAEEIIQPGKLYFKDNFIFVNEYMEGIHIVDNSDPASPQVVKFLEIPGNVDLAIKGTILFADSYIDLLAIDISDFENIQEVKRIENAFPYLLPATGEGLIEAVDENQGVVTGWKKVEKTVRVENNNLNYRYYTDVEGDWLVNVGAPEAGASLNNSGFGIGGSMARFTLYDNFLYTVDYAMLRLFNITEASNPLLAGEFNVGWDIETIFPYGGKLFLGSQTGMYIYSLEDPLNPEYISSFWHASSCDPVVVEGNYAYVTLRAGNLCGDNQSQLDVIDITDIYNPFLLKEYPMEEPYGLGIDGSVLFVCDGSAGLKIYDASNPHEISENLIKQYQDIHAFDVIPLGDVLLMIGSDGLFQYDYSDLENISQLSFIPIYN